MCLLCRPRTAGIYKLFPAVRGINPCAHHIRTDAGRLFSNYFCKSNEFINSLALHSQSSQKGGDLYIRSLSAHDFIHKRFGFRTAEMPAFDYPLNALDNIHFNEYIRKTMRLRKKTAAKFVRNVI